MKKNTKLQWFKFSTLVCLFFLSGCHAPEKKIGSATLLLDWWTNPNHIPIYVGIEKGIFKKYGIELNILNLQEPPDSILYLMTGRVDLSLYYMPHSLRAYANHSHFKVVGKLMEHSLHTFLCRADSGIEKVEDFENKSFGLFPDGITRAILDTMMSRYNVHLGNLHTIQFDLNTVLYTKSVDVISGVFWNIEPFQLQAKGIETKCFKWSDFDFPDYPELVFLASNTYLAKNPKFGKKFQKALQESIDFCLENKEEAFLVYQKVNPDHQKEEEWERKAWYATTDVLAKTQAFDKRNLKGFYDWMCEYQLISQDFDAESILDNSIVTK